MRITLIGMSGSGKSRWSRKLEERNFRRFACDDLIARKLFPELQRQDDAVELLGEWMGLPSQPGYGEREARYLAAEIEVLAGIVAHLRSPAAGAGEDVVVDTTGSVIYSGDEILSELCRLTVVVHLATPPEVREAMLRAYKAQPRPVLWRGIYAKRPDESDDQALARCYATLLATRELAYRQYAHVTVDYHQRAGEHFGVAEFLREIGAKLQD